MKNSLKRIVSLFLCLAMVLCIPAFAAEEDVIDGHDGHDCAEHEVVIDSGLPFAEQNISDDGIAVTAAADCKVHIYSLLGFSAEYSLSLSHTVYIPGGNPVPCYVTEYYRNYMFYCGCGDEFTEPRKMREVHTLSSYH